MSLQGITVAISPSGIQYFVTSVLVPEIVTAITNVTLPAVNISLGDIQLSSSKLGWTEALGVTVALSAGSLALINPDSSSSTKTLPFTPTFQSLTQGSNGQFTLTLAASNVQAAYTWTESYDEQEYGEFGTKDLGQQKNTYSYSVTFATMTIMVVFDFAFNNNQWQLQFNNASATTTGVTPNIPSDSVVNLQDQGTCFGAQISQATQNAVDTINFNTVITNVIQPIFTSIPASGNLTPNIVFQFPIGPSGLTFPNNSGIATGVTGVATYQGTAYPGANPPQLSLPPVPANSYLNYYVSDYSFNSLMWAFFQAGDLVTTVNPGDIPTPGDLNTSIYQNTPLQALSNQYPNTPMSAGVTALSAPTVQFVNIYELTATNMTGLSQLSATQLTALGALKGVVYLDEPTFFAAVVNALGQTAADQYRSPIEQAALAVGAVVTHNIKVVLNVLNQGLPTPVITFSVNETDVLQAFALGVSTTTPPTQTLKFAFQLVSSLTTATFVSSTIPGITSGNFTDLWNFVLQPMYSQQLAAMGTAGVALPRIQGFDFLFNSATVTLQPGYASVLANVQYSASAQPSPVATAALGGD